MATFPAAQLEIDDVNIVVVFPDASFGALTLDEKRARHAAFENCAARARMQGEVVAVWQDAEGRTRFLAPPEQHAFFQIVRYGQLRAQVNGTLECDC